MLLASVEARSLATNRNVSYYTFCNVYMYIFEVSQRVPRYSFMYMLRLKMIILIMVIIDEGNFRYLITNYKIVIEKIPSKANNI